MNLRPPTGSIKKKRRVGRGQGSGNGCTSGRGNKGQKSRSGYSEKIGFEGGQMPLSRRVPKRGFNNATFEKSYQLINVKDLARYEDGTKVDYDLLLNDGLVKKTIPWVKLCGNGSLDKKLDVVIHRVSRHARKIVEKAGGTVRVVSKVKKI